MTPIVITCRDGYALAGHLWLPAPTSENEPERGTVIVNAATGVLARYYHRYARFLTEHGFAVITFDYRGIGDSRPASLRESRARWCDWGELDFDAVVEWARARTPSGLLAVVGHSIGGFLPGLAPAASRIDRVLAVGGQYAYWRDYARQKRLSFLFKWHVVMPVLTALFGYFPGRKLGWLEDLPAGVAYEWSGRRARFEASFAPSSRLAILERFAAVKAPILAVAMTDDEFATPEAVLRGLDYYRGARCTFVHLEPAALGVESVGHFGLFHARHRDTFWRASVDWLADGTNPWSGA